MSWRNDVKNVFLVRLQTISLQIYWKNPVTSVFLRTWEVLHEYHFVEHLPRAPYEATSTTLFAGKYKET